MYSQCFIFHGFAIDKTYRNMWHQCADCWGRVHRNFGSHLTRISLSGEVHQFMHKLLKRALKSHNGNFLHMICTTIYPDAHREFQLDGRLAVIDCSHCDTRLYPIPDIQSPQLTTDEQIQFFSCKICMSNHINFIGHCGHPMCRTCMDTLSQNKGPSVSLKCPFCRSNYEAIPIFN